VIEVYICEDDRAQLEGMKKTLEEAIAAGEMEMKVELAAADPSEFLEAAKKRVAKGDARLYVIDMDLKSDMNGLDLAESIRAMETGIDARSYIVFATAHAEMSMLAFQYLVEAIDYIVKNAQFDANLAKTAARIHKKHMDDLSYRQTGGGRYIAMHAGKRIIERFADIFLIETSQSQHKITMHTNSGMAEYASSLRDAEEALQGGNFVRLSESCLVNADKIASFDKAQRTVTLSNGLIREVSTRKIKALQASLMSAHAQN
jgi:two-component system response regulator AgrA